MKMGGKTYNNMWKTHGETVREMIALHFWLFFHIFFGVCLLEHKCPEMVWETNNNKHAGNTLDLEVRTN